MGREYQLGRGSAIEMTARSIPLDAAGGICLVQPEGPAGRRRMDG
jgi:hypothetical protein